MKKVTLNVPNYSPDTGVALNWEGNFTIKVSDINGSVSIEANTEGLVSLANHLLNLSQSSVPIGTHLHLDEYNSLEEGSLDLNNRKDLIPTSLFMGLTIRSINRFIVKSKSVYLSYTYTICRI